MLETATESIRILPEFLVGLFEGRTTAQAEPLVREYIGRPMTVTADIVDIDPPDRGGRAFMILRRDNSLETPTIAAWFDEAWVERISVRRAGETITVTGSVQNVDRSHVTLDDCTVHA